jgi:hypothetical protein
MTKPILLSILFFIAMPISAESINYEISAISKDNVKTVLVQGVKEYSVKDIVVEESKKGRETHWSKSLPLEKDFSVGASVYREKKLEGFGLWAKDGGARSFSWEWFSIEKPGVFNKLQEGGSIEVTYQGGPLVEEIAAISFKTDISLRINNSSEVGGVTHRVLIKKGSVLRFAP